MVVVVVVRAVVLMAKVRLTGPLRVGIGLLVKLHAAPAGNVLLHESEILFGKFWDPEGVTATVKSAACPAVTDDVLGFALTLKSVTIAGTGRELKVRPAASTLALLSNELPEVGVKFTENVVVALPFMVPTGQVSVSKFPVVTGLPQLPLEVKLVPVMACVSTKMIPAIGSVPVFVMV